MQDEIGCRRAIGGSVPVIDADCHVIESTHTWDYFDESEVEYRPLSLVSDRPARDGEARFMAINGRLRTVGFATPRGDVKETLAGYDRTTEATRMLTDVRARVRHMDELGVDIQVLYPTLYLSQITTRPKEEAALSRSYNHWLADIWAQGQGRLRWVAVLPLLDMDEARSQLGWAVERGACGVFMRGFEGQRILSDPYFFPLYEEAQRRNVPICVHAGGANPAFRDLVKEAFSGAKLPVISAFHTLLYNGIPTKFPELRFGFVEVSASWVPYVLTDLQRRLIRDGRLPLTENPLKDNRMYVACQTNDDLPYVIQCVGEDNLMIGSDYGHSDTSTELEALRTIHKTSPVEPRIVKKILEDNPKALYGL
jgi:predicted TIM-barrel fold metal-dependent hydrolase